ncbi:MAG TPA: M28 family peptidase, partial [Thermoproteales archaeon]|nr:M28 family peptidase [Thermoproteales archaeon]
MADLGAKAIIFIEPPSTNRLESFTKFLYVNFYMPRVYLKREKGNFLKNLVLKSGSSVKAKLYIEYSLKEVKSANVIAFIKGSEYPNDTIVLSAYIDDWSPVPELASQHDTASGAAVLLETARILSKIRPKLSVLIVFFTGHWEGLAGVRAFVEDIFDYFVDHEITYHPVWNYTRPKFMFSLDLSTGSKNIAIVHSGGFYHIVGPALYDYSGQMYQDAYLNFQLEWRQNLTEIVKNKMKQKIEVYYQMYDQAGEAYTMARNEYFTAIPYKYFSDVEAWIQAGLPGYAIFTADDYRYGWFTPLKNKHLFDFNNLKVQATYIISLLYLFTNTKTDMYPPPRTWGPTRYYFPGPFYPYVPGFTRVRGQLVEYSPLSAKQYEPINEKAVVVIVDTTDEYNVFNYIYLYTEPNGTFTVYGLGVLRTYKLRAYMVNYSTGEIYYAADLGRYGAGEIPSTQVFQVRTGVYGWPQPLRFVVFPCAQIVLFNVMFPQGALSLATFTDIYRSLTLRDINILVRKFESHSEEYHYGYEIDPFAQTMVVYVPWDEKIEVEVGIRSEEGPIQLSILLINASEEKPEGNGYLLRRRGETLVFRRSILHYILNFYYLGGYRAKLAHSFNVRDPESEKSLSKTEEWLSRTIKAFNEKRFSEAYADSLIAWAWSQRLYFSSRNLIEGSSTTTIVYFVMLIPFAFVLERLLFEFVEGKKRLLAILATFAISMGVMWIIHPGFHLVSSAPILVLGLTILAITTVIGFLLYTDFRTVIWHIRKRTLGAHFVEVSRWDVMVASLYYGVVNLKRHKLTSSLTLFAVIVITLSTVSLTSVAFLLTPKPISIGAEPVYKGMLVRYVSYNPLPQTMSEFLSAIPEIGSPSLRAWLYGPIRGSTQWGEIPIDYGDKRAYAKAIVGLSLLDGDALKIKLTLVYGRWDDLFREYSEDTIPCIMSKSLAKDLGLEYAPEIVKMWGIKLLVVDFFEPRVLEGIKDIDGETLAPLDIWSVEAQGITTVTERLEWDNIIIVPYRILSKIPSSITFSIALVGGKPEAAEQAAKTLSQMTYNMFLFVSDGKKIKGYTSVSGLSTT